MILPFSTFVTQIPFILMALVYLVFFGVSALSKTSQKEEAKIVSDNQQHTKQFEATVTKITTKTLNYQSLVSANQQIAVTDESVPVPDWRPCENIRFFDTGPRTYKNFFSHSIFCRPPPVLA